MSTELTTTKNTNGGNRELSSGSGRVARQGRTQAPGQISRDGLAKLHQTAQEEHSDLRDTSLGKGLGATATGIQNSLNSGLQVLSSGSKGIIDTFKQGGKKKGVRSALLAGVAGIFGLKTLQGLLDIPKKLSRKEEDGKSAPFLISAAKWVAGGSLALGALKAFTTGAGISNPALLVGLGVFAALSLVTSAYENENSGISKVLNIFGLRNKVKVIADDFKADQLVSN